MNTFSLTQPLKRALAWLLCQSTATHRKKVSEVANRRDPRILNLFLFHKQQNIAQKMLHEDQKNVVIKGRRV